MNSGTRFSHIKQTLKGLLFCCFSFFPLFIITLFLTLPFLLTHFLSPRFYTKVLDWMAEIYAPYITGLHEFTGTKIYVYSDEDEINESSIIMMNHQNQLDWLYYCTLIARNKNMGQYRVVCKSDVRNIPFVGLFCQILVFLFIERDWKKDEIKMKKYGEYLRFIEKPVKIVIFCEGTNLHPQAIEKSNAFALKNNLPLYKYVLHPRVTGFVNLYMNLISDPKPMITSVYDATIYYGGKIFYSELELIHGNFQEEVHIVLKKYKTVDLPKTSTEIGNWVADRWKEKEQNLKEFYENGQKKNFQKLSSKSYPFPSFVKIFIFINLTAIFLLSMLIYSRMIEVYFVLTILFTITCGYYYGIDNLILSTYKH